MSQISNPSSNLYLEVAQKESRLPPSIDDLRPEDPSLYLARLSELESPSQRLKTFFKSLVNAIEAPTHEAEQVRKLAFVCSMSAGILGGILNNRDLHTDFARQHNASVFENRYTANRLFWDYLLMGVARKGLKYAVVSGVLSGSAGIVMFGSLAYRNQLHYPDWVAGFALIGSASRLWIGTRGVIAGAVLGSLTGLFFFGLFKAWEVTSGISMAQRRYEHHYEWLNRRESAHRILLQRQKEHNDGRFKM